MNIDHIQLPPVSEKFYNRLQRAFPAINPLDITEDTTILSIQRNAAQQEVIEFISKAVKKEEPDKNSSFLSRFKYVFKQ